MDGDLVSEQIAPPFPLVVSHAVVEDEDGVGRDVSSLFDGVDDGQHTLVVDWALGDVVL